MLEVLVEPPVVERLVVQSLTAVVVAAEEE
jgi:hypothetical protein